MITKYKQQIDTDTHDDNLSFVSLILPFFGTSILLIFNVFVYYNTGNALLGFWLIYLLLLLPRFGIYTRIAKFFGADLFILNKNLSA